MDQEDETLLTERKNEYLKISSGLNDLQCNVLFNFLLYVISEV